MPVISIIIPVLNEAAFIEKQLIYLRSLIDADCEIILVDGGSDDDTVVLATPFVDRLLVSDQSGRAYQMNAGAAVAKGNILLFVHADTNLPIDFYQRLIAIDKQRWGFFCIALSGQLWPFRIIEFMMNLRSKITRVATGDQCLFVLRQTFQEIGGFASIPLMEDVELSKRLRKLSPPHVVNARVVTSSRRWEQKGIVQTVLLMWRLRWDYFWGSDPHQLVKKYYPPKK